MPGVKTTLLVALAVVAAAFALFWFRSGCAAVPPGAPAPRRRWPSPYELLVGFITDFLDTLGIGSFATTTALWRARRTVADEDIPGTLNVGHTLPTVTQAFLYLHIVEVEPTTLIAMIVAAVAGAQLGAPLVARWPRRWVQVGLGCALLVLCTVLVVRQFGDPEGGQDLGLAGSGLVLGIVGNFLLGALMTIGVGLYAPCLLLVSLLGLNPRTGFPIMMGSCAFLMPFASAAFMRRQRFSAPAALGLTLAGIPAVLVAALIVKELDLRMVKWLVAVVVVYTAITLLRTAARERPGPAP